MHQIQRSFLCPKESSPDQVCCEQCGSVYFAQSEFRQYRYQYGALPGGDLSPVTEDPIRVLVCICGNPMEQGTLRRWSIPRALRPHFQKSFEAARRYREGLVTREQYDQLAKQITDLKALLKSRKSTPSSRSFQDLA